MTPGYGEPYPSCPRCSMNLESLTVKTYERVSQRFTAEWDSLRLSWRLSEPEYDYEDDYEIEVSGPCSCRTAIENVVDIDLSQEIITPINMEALLAEWAVEQQSDLEYEMSDDLAEALRDNVEDLLIQPDEHCKMCERPAGLLAFRLAGACYCRDCTQVMAESFLMEELL